MRFICGLVLIAVASVLYIPMIILGIFEWLVRGRNRKNYVFFGIIEWEVRLIAKLIGE